MADGIRIQIVREVVAPPPIKEVVITLPWAIYGILMDAVIHTVQYNNTPYWASRKPTLREFLNARVNAEDSQ